MRFCPLLPVLLVPPRLLGPCSCHCHWGGGATVVVVVADSMIGMMGIFLSGCLGLWWGKSGPRMEDLGAQIHNLCYLVCYDCWYLCCQTTRHICASLLLLQGSLLVWTQLQLEEGARVLGTSLLLHFFPFSGAKVWGLSLWSLSPHVWWGCGLSQSSQGIGIVDIIHVFPPVPTPICTSIHTPSDALIGWSFRHPSVLSRGTFVRL